MKWVGWMILTVILNTDPAEISRINGLKRKAKESFLAGNFPAAIDYYHTLTDSLGAEDDELYLNLAHAYYQHKDKARARTYYSQAATARKPAIRSIAYQQLGALAKEEQQLEESLEYLKAAIKANPDNRDARYDFELVKKLLKEQQQQNQEQEQQDQEQQENQDQNESQDQKNEDQKNEKGQEQDQQEQEQKEEQDQEKQEQGQEKEEEQQGQEQEQEQEQEQQDPKDMSTEEKLEQMNISEEKARMILEAMRNNEIQYLQQQRRKPSKRPETGKPDW